MALESIGLAAQLTFDADPAVRGMKKAQRSFGDLKAEALKTGKAVDRGVLAWMTKVERQAYRTKQATAALRDNMKGLGRGIGTAAKGVERLGLTLLPAALGMAGGVFQAARYEKQLSGMRAVMRGLSEEQFAELVAKTRELGIESVFSATQSAAAMEQLGILGFKHHEILAAIGPVLNAAAVAGTDLASSAQIVGGATRAMGLEIKEAGRVADVLTVAGQKSATTLPQMSEAITYGASAALKWGMDLEETVAVLGKLADRMHQGSAGGMLLMNVVKSLTAPSQQAEKVLKDLGVEMVNADRTGFRPLIDVLVDIRKELDKETDAAERARKESVLFGARAGRAFAALADTGVKATNELRDELKKSMGAAEEAAKTRLDNMLGAFTLFASSLESLSITMFEPFLKEGKDAVQGVTTDLNSVLYAMADLEQQVKEGHEEWSAFHFVASKHGPKTTEVAKGIRDAMENLKDTLLGVGETFGLVTRSADGAFGPGAYAKMTEYMTSFILYGAMIAPVGLAIRGITAAVSGLLWVMAPLKPAVMAAGGAIRWAFLTQIKLSATKVWAFYYLLKWKLVKAMRMVTKQSILMAAKFALIAAAVLGIIAAFYILIKRWDDIKARMQDIGATIYEFLHPGEKIERVGRGIAGKPVEPPKVKDLTTIIGEEISGAVKEAQKKLTETTMDVTGETAAQAEGTRDAAQAAAAAAAAAAEAAKKKPCAKINVDGREVAKAGAKAEAEIKARSGERAVAWQRSQIVVRGAIPAT